MKSPKKKENKNLLKATPTVALRITNPEVAAEPATIYSGTKASLRVSLGNLTDSDITISKESSLEIFMPRYFTKAEVKAMQVTSAPDGWYFTYNSGSNSLSLKSNADSIWAKNTPFAFSIDDILSAATNGNDTVQVSITDFKGANIPAQVSATLLLIAKPKPQRINLKDVLTAKTEFGGQIYVSTAIDPLTNNLYLDLKNTGPTPLYNGTKDRSGNPQVTVSFVYGSTSGSLAPDNKQNSGQQGSAWGISAGISVNQTGGGWAVNNPSATGSANSPAWVLSPVMTNQQIIGINDQANISFVFSNIFSFTPTGPTQMYVQFTGFPQSEQNMYNDCVFVVDILKTDPPPYRGILNFFGQKKYYIKEMQDISVQVKWSAFQIASVSLETNAAPLPIPSPYTKSYPNPVPLLYDTATVLLPDVHPDTDITFNLEAFDGNKGELNNKQHIFSALQKPGIYKFDGPANVVNYTMNQPAIVQLDWKVYSVAMIEIYEGEKKLTQKQYKPSPLWNTESATFDMNIDGVNSSQTFTLKSYDRDGILLEAMTLTVNYAATAWCDPKDKKVYPLVRVNNQVWLGSNYDYVDPDGSYWYNNDQKNAPLYGRLYTFPSALRNVPSGWRLPMNADWSSLIKLYGSNAFNALMVGGASGLNLPVGGSHYSPTPGGYFNNMGRITCYYGYSRDPKKICYLLPTKISNQLTLADLPAVNCPKGCMDAGYLRFIYAPPGSEVAKDSADEFLLNPDEVMHILQDEKE